MAATMKRARMVLVRAHERWWKGRWVQVSSYFRPISYYEDPRQLLLAL